MISVHELEYTNRRVPLDWLGWRPLVALIPLGHFTISMGLWLVVITGQEGFAGYYLVQSLSVFGPAAGLLALSVVAYILALKRRPASMVLVLIIVLCSAALFWTDVRLGRYQITVDMATTEYQGGHYSYLNWWWYNDRWFGGGK